ncbi:hypothetical protein ZWY2020_045320 [Hordeum vulgare]|nr:hypothetical protein ZWY2020_045320 [Hordeum vulgare]
MGDGASGSVSWANGGWGRGPHVRSRVTQHHPPRATRPRVGRAAGLRVAARAPRRPARRPGHAGDVVAASSAAGPAGAGFRTTCAPPPMCASRSVPATADWWATWPASCGGVGGRSR